MFSKLIENLCYGMRPSDFLQQELTLNPIQKRTAQRIFVIMMLFAVIAVSTRLPGLRVTAFFLAILLPQMILTSRMALDVMKLLSQLMIVSVATSLATLVLWQDQGWFRYPFAIGLIVLMMFHARKSRLPNILPIFFGSLVLYNTSNPIVAVDNALWTLLIMTGAIVVTAALIAYVLWPRSSLELLRERVRLRLHETGTLLEGLMQLAPGSLPDTRLQKARHTAGWTADTLKHLDDAIRDQPAFAERKGYWVEAVMELDNLASGLTDFQRLWADAEPAKPIMAEELALIRAIQHRLNAVNALFESHGEAIPTSTPLPPDELDHPGMSPLLIRLYLAVDRLMDSLIGVYHGDPLPLEAPIQEDTAGIYPLWLSNAYWNENRPILLWSLKVAIACAIVTLLVVSMNAGEVDTAILTTIIVADTTLGADVRKSIMRLVGALLGALLGYL
ncbi:MAG: hypothetical protein RLZZ627_1970, partial [Pseudomonadota bacterium]